MPKLNFCDWCNPPPNLREPVDFIYYFVRLFGEPINPPAKTVYDEKSLVEAVENASVLDVMRALTYLWNNHSKDRDLIQKIYDHLVVERQLWYSTPQPPKKGQNQQIIRVAEHTPWRYFHDVLRRRDFSGCRFVLQKADSARYLICLESFLNGKKTIEELGICDEHFSYLKCDCNFQKVKVLCSRCNGYVSNKQCESDVLHKFSSVNIRCFRIDHGKVRDESVNLGQYVTSSVEVNIKEPKPLNRFEPNRRSSRKKKSPKISPVQDEPPTYQQFEETRKSPEIVLEKPSRKSPPFVPESLKNPYDQTPIVEEKRDSIQSRESPSPKEQLTIQPPPRVIPVQQEPSFEEPPLVVRPDEIHERPYEGTNSPIPRLPTPEPDTEEIVEPPRQRPPNFTDSVPETLRPQRKSPVLTEIPIHREPVTPRISDIERLTPTFPKPPPPRYEEVPQFRPRYDYPPFEPTTPTKIPRPNATPPLPPRDEAKFNVVVVGPTGVGKSTWINALANYLRYENMADARNNELICVIPTTFKIQDHDYNEYAISFGKPSENEVYVPGESNTRRPQQYRFRAGRNTVNIIDTPGVTDTRGLQQDELNCRMILEELENLDPTMVHAIAIVLKANESRLGPSLEQAIISLLSLFPRSAIPNIAFFFTYARGTLFRVGDTYNCLAQLFDQIEKNHGTRLRLSSESVYCVDNEAFRYLVVCFQSNPQLQSLMLRPAEYENSWHQSQHESARFFERLQRIKPVDTREITLFNSIRRIAEELAKLILQEQENGTEAFKLAYEVVLDYLIQHSIIVIDPLMREIIRSKRPVPLDLGNQYFVDHRIVRTETVTTEEIYRYVAQFREIKHLDYEFRRTIEKYMVNYEQYYKRPSITDKSVRNSEIYTDLPIIYGPGETTYSCLEERRTVITEKVHVFDSRPPSFMEATSIHSTV